MAAGTATGALQASNPSTGHAAALAPSAPTSPASVITVPSVQQWTPRRGRFTLKKPTIVVRGASAELRQVAGTFAEDLRGLTGQNAPVASGGRVAKGSIQLRLGDQKHGPESYRIDVDASITITGTTPRAVFNGTRTVLQWLAQAHELPSGTAVDWPLKEVRSLLLDNTPRHFSLEFWENLFRIMAWFKLNDTNLYVDGVGITPEQARRIDQIARKYYVKVVPQLNMPAHMHVMLPAHPEYQLVNTDGTRNIVALDLTNPKAVAWALGLLEQWLDVFSGDEWHLGSDEFPGWPGTGASHPQLDAYAKERFGPKATFADLFADYQNQANALVKKHGKKMRVWNDMIRQSEVVQLDRDVTVEYWIQHDALPGLLSAQEVADRGNKLINCHIDRLYYDQSRRNLDPQDIWDKFERDRFPFDQVVNPSSSVRGARICVWLAWIYTPMESDAEVLHNLIEPIQAFSQEVWGSPRPVEAYGEFATLAEKVGLPGGLNPDGPNSLQPSPAVAANQNGSLAYCVRDADGTLWTGHQSVPHLMHFTRAKLAEGVVGSPVAVTGSDGRITVVSRTSADQLLVARQTAANVDDYKVRRLSVRVTGQPVLAGRVAVVATRGGKLVAVDVVSGSVSTLGNQVVGDPSIALVGDRHHVVARTGKGLLHTWLDASWQTTVGPVPATGSPLVLAAGGKAVVLVVNDGTVRSAPVGNGAANTWSWSTIGSGAAGELFGRTNSRGEAHATWRTGAGQVVHASSSGSSWTVRTAGDQMVDDPTLGFDGAGRPHLFAHTVRRTLRVWSPAGGTKYEWADLAESQLGQVQALADSAGMITWFGVMEYGDLLAGARWGGGIWDWGRDIVVGTYAYPVDELQPDQFPKVLARDDFSTDSASRYELLKPSARESAPPLEVAGGVAGVRGTKYFSMFASQAKVAAEPTTVMVEVDTLLEQARDQNTFMVGFMRDEKNYSTMWASHVNHRIGFDTVSNGRLMPDGGNGNVPFVFLPGDRLAVTLALNWMVAYVQRQGVWYRVHAAVCTGDDDLRDAAVRAQYRCGFALRGDDGRLAIGDFLAATR